MNRIKKHGGHYLLLIVLLAAVLSSCQKSKDYYLDSGQANPYFKGTVMDYLDAKPFYFDSLALIVKLAGLDSVLTNDSVTLFAPMDPSIARLINAANSELFFAQYDTIRTLQDVPGNIWRKYLSRYIFHGANQLKDYPQIDYDLLVNYPGQGYLSWDGAPMNIGVIYYNDNGVKYVGYRQLSIAYIPDVSSPTFNWTVNYVGSSNILTDNGVVHVLSDGNPQMGDQSPSGANPFFGFDIDGFINDMSTIMARGENGN
jgi:hypothetical protein